MSYLATGILYNPEAVGEKIRELIEPLEIVGPLWDAMVTVAEVYGDGPEARQHLRRLAAPIMRKVSHRKEYMELAKGTGIDPNEPGLIGVFLLVLIGQEYIRRTEVIN